MKDIGILVALSGKDVHARNNEDMAITTDTDTLKLVVDDADQNSGVIQVKFVNPGNVPGTKQLVYRKVLPPEYNTLFYFAFNIVGSSNPVAQAYGNTFDMDVFGDRQFKAFKVGNVVEFYFIVSPFYFPTAGDTLAGRFYEFQFAFYTNQGI